MEKTYSVAGYVKLAKLWERSEESAVQYHHNYYENKFSNTPSYCLYDVYIDITGNKQIYKRMEMVRLLRDCTLGKINCISAQSRAYLAANTEELCYLLHYLFHLGIQIDIVTDDETMEIDTIRNPDHQREALSKMADDYVAVDPAAYQNWCHKLVEAMNKLIVAVRTNKGV